MSANVTILDVARLAKVSRQTVTRALNDLPDISAATRARVVSAALELNYRPNRAAQGLVKGRSSTVGLVIEDLGNPYFAELASALTRLAAERSWAVLLCDIGADREKARVQLGSIAGRVDALVLTGCRTDTLSLLPSTVRRSDGLGLPLLMLDGGADERLDGRLVLDLEAGMSAAVDHLASRGRRRIAFVDSAVGPTQRRDAYRRSLRQRDLAWSELSELRADESYAGGIDAAGRIFDQYPRADAVVAYNDVIAVGVLKGFARQDVAVPGDIAVIGIDGLEIGRLATPELTTMSINMTEMVGGTVDLLADLLTDSRRHRNSDRSVSLQLLVREST